MCRFIEIHVTFNKKDEANKILNYLVSNRMAACAQIIGPVNSIFSWKNKIEKEEEWLGIIKTRKSFFYKIEKTVKEMHSYDVPQIIAIPIVKISSDYEKWLSSETEINRQRH